MNKKVVLALVCLIGAVSYCSVSTHLASIPPSDAECVKRFYDHRNNFEKLREMLEHERNISEITENGISTKDSGFDRKTPEQLGFPVQRYKDYLALFRQTGVILAESSDDKREFFFHIFHSPGGALGTRLATAIVWREDPPQNQIASAEEYWKKPSGGKTAYRHIDGKWYLLMSAP